MSDGIRVALRAGCRHNLCIVNGVNKMQERTVLCLYSEGASVDVMSSIPVGKSILKYIENET